MSILLRGSLRERAGRRSELALPLSVSFMDADVLHDDEFGPSGATLFQVHFEDADLASACAAMHGWRWVHGGPVVGQFMRLVEAVRAGDRTLAEHMVADVLAAASDDARSALRDAPAWLDDVRALIDDSDGWLRVSEITRAARVHRVYLARQFRRHFGCSVSDYVRRRRVQAAANAMTSRRDSLSAIAHACGFHDHAHMCRAFRRELGLAPSALQRAITNDQVCEARKQFLFASGTS